MRLQGQRVLVTRPAQQGAALGGLLLYHGANVIYLPLIEIAPPPDEAPFEAAMQQLDQYDYVIFTSANAVDQVAARLTTPWPEQVKVASVGPATSAALRDYGLPVDLQPDEAVADALMPLLGDIDGDRIFFPRALHGRETLPQALLDAGAELDLVPVYQTLRNQDAPAQLRRLLQHPLDWVTLLSPSAVHAFLSALPAGAPALRYASIGPVTSQALREHGLEPDAEAEPHTAEGLVEAVLHATVKS